MSGVTSNNLADVGFSGDVYWFVSHAEEWIVGWTRWYEPGDESFVKEETYKFVNGVRITRVAAGLFAGCTRNMVKSKGYLYVPKSYSLECIADGSTEFLV